MEELDEGFDPVAQIAASEALLSHVHWVCGDLTARVESFNQRAGVLLAASVGIVAVGFQTLPAASWLLTVKLALPWVLPISFALYTLTVTASHSIGPAPIRAYLGQPGGPDLRRGHWMARELLNAVTSPAGNEPSVLEGLNALCERKATNLQWTQITFILALLASIIGGVQWAVVHAITL